MTAIHVFSCREFPTANKSHLVDPSKQYTIIQMVKCIQPQVNHKLAWYLAWGYQCFTRLKLYSCKQGLEKRILEHSKIACETHNQFAHIRVNSDHST